MAHPFTPLTKKLLASNICPELNPTLLWQHPKLAKCGVSRQIQSIGEGEGALFDVFLRWLWRGGHGARLQDMQNTDSTLNPLSSILLLWLILIT